MDGNGDDIFVLLVVAVDMVMLGVEWFEHLLELLYMYPLSLLLPLLSFEQLPDVLSHNLLNWVIRLSLPCLWQAFLSLNVKVWNSLELSWSKTYTNW